MFCGPEKLRIIPASQSQIVVALGQLLWLLTPKLQLFKGTGRSVGRKEVILALPVDGTDGKSQEARWAVVGGGAWTWTQAVGFPGGASGKEPACHGRRHKSHGFDPWVGKIPWRRKWQPTPVFLPGESHGKRSLAGYSPWGHKETRLSD